MNIGKTFQWLFMEKSMHTTLEKRRKVEVGSKSDAAAPLKSEAASQSSGRDELKKSALSVLRDRQDEFEALDQDIQDRVAKVAEKAITSSKKKKI